MIRLVFATGLVEGNKPHYYLTELESYEGFDLVIREVIKHGPKLVNQIDGIYSRTALFDIDSKKFKVIYHDDIGVYAFSEDDINGEEEWLRKTLTNVVDGLNASK